MILFQSRHIISQSSPTRRADIKKDVHTRERTFRTIFANNNVTRSSCRVPLKFYAKDDMDDNVM